MIDTLIEIDSNYNQELDKCLPNSLFFVLKKKDSVAELLIEVGDETPDEMSKLLLKDIIRFRL